MLGRVVGPMEPLWLPEDTEAVLEYLREQALICQGCGLPRDETMNPEAEGSYRSRAFRCHACSARDREARKFADQKTAGGIYFTTEKVD